MSTTGPEVQDYLDGLGEPARARVDRVRALVREELPAAEERLSYGVPSFRQDGRTVVFVGGWARHVALYPLPTTDTAAHVEESLAAAMAPYVAGRGTLRVPHTQDLPEDLLRRVVRALAAQAASR